uniref:Si:ch211-180a12.2 n=2 Tax=Electrophorus electricus TaxID=8005 RepID=A0AAY5E878_ELEEL
MKFKVLCFLCLLGPIKLGFSAVISVPLGSSVVLPCSFILPTPVNDEHLNITWTLEGLVVASNLHVERGFYLNPLAIVDGSFALTVINATTHQQGVYECSVISNGTEYSTNISLAVMAPPTLSIPSRTVVLGRESVVECRAKGFSPPWITFSWTRAGKQFESPQVFKANRTEDGLFEAVSRVTLVPEPTDQNNTYSCTVQHEALEKPLVQEFNMTVIILPKVTLSVVPSSSHSSPLTLACDINGFYPSNMSVAWVQHGTTLSEPPQARLNGDGTYTSRHFHTLSMEETDRAGWVQCEAQQPHVSQPASGSIDLSAASSLAREIVLTKSAKASVAMMIISLILIFLLCFGFSWKRRDEKQKSLTISAIILPPRVVVGQKGRVTICIEGRRADRVETAWFLNDIPIVDTSYTGEKSYGPIYSTDHGHTHKISRASLASEKGPLLLATAPGYYKLCTQQPLHTSGPTKQLLSSVTFVPNLSVHKGAVFKCQISYQGKDNIVMEKISNKFTILAPPEVSEIQLSEPNEESGIVTLTVSASGFHPDVITFRWFCEGGELSPLAAPLALAAPRPDTQGFFSAMSQCRLPKDELERGKTIVWVTVHHMSLKQPVTRKTIGFLKKPIISEIRCSSSTLQQPLTLACDIAGFYPPDITVQWLKRGKSEEQEEDVVLGEREVWGPVQTSPRMFQATALIKEVDEAEEILCRVEHCSLLEPIERVWRKIHLVAPSVALSLSVNWRDDGVGVFSLYLSGGVPHPTLLWAAGSTTLSPLLSRETEQAAEERERVLISICAVAVAPETQGAERQPHRSKLLHYSQIPGLENEAMDKTTSERENTWEKKGDEGKVPLSSDIICEERTDSVEEELQPSYINTVNHEERGKTQGETALRVAVEIT